MTNMLKTLAVALTLVGGAAFASALAVAGTDATYHWGYPDQLKSHPNIPVQSFSVGNGIPAQYR